MKADYFCKLLPDETPEKTLPEKKKTKSELMFLGVQIPQANIKLSPISVKLKIKDA